MKVLFLDVDGVLNKGCGGLYGEMLDRLERVVKSTGCSVVVHSTWRHREAQMARLINELNKRGIDIYDTTPDLSTKHGEIIWQGASRAGEISAWLADHPHVTRFAIVDDARFPQLNGWLVQTVTDKGLQDEHAELLIELLK